MVTEKSAIESFRRCIEREPKKADHWHALGASYVPEFLNSKTTASQEKSKQSFEAYQKSMSLGGSSFDRLYQCSIAAEDFSVEESIALMRRAIAAKSSNAVLYYDLGFRLFRSAAQKGDSTTAVLQNEAIDFVASGNQAPKYELEKINLPVPTILGVTRNA